MKDNQMDNIVECAYNMDNGYVEVWFTSLDKGTQPFVVCDG